MAFNTTEISLITRTITQLKESRGDKTINVLSLGNPDLLITREQAANLLGKAITDTIKVQPNSREVATRLNKKVLEEGIYDTPSFFQALGVTFTVIDFQADAGHEEIWNLNYPLPSVFNRTYDLVLDPATTEHVFDVATCMANICRLTAIGGYVYHSTPMIHPNHGFYSFSPTFYMDFYEKNGFEIVQLAYWENATDEHGFCVNLRQSPIVEFFPTVANSVIGNSVLVRRLVDKPIQSPIQRAYGGP